MPQKILHVDETGTARCWWCLGNPLYVHYHDEEWGFPVSDEFRLFEKICLEGFQAGLSWLTILRKRDNFRRAFKRFDFHQIARFNRRSVDRLLGDAGIVRHPGKIESVINNARRAVELAEEHGRKLKRCVIRSGGQSDRELLRDDSKMSTFRIVRLTPSPMGWASRRSRGSLTQRLNEEVVSLSRCFTFIEE